MKGNGSHPDLHLWPKKNPETCSGGARKKNPNFNQGRRPYVFLKKKKRKVPGGRECSKTTKVGWAREGAKLRNLGLWGEKKRGNSLIAKGQPFETQGWKKIPYQCRERCEGPSTQGGNRQMHLPEKKGLFRSGTPPLRRLGGERRERYLGRKGKVGPKPSASFLWKRK